MGELPRWDQIAIYKIPKHNKDKFRERDRKKRKGGNPIMGRNKQLQ